MADSCCSCKHKEEDVLYCVPAAAAAPLANGHRVTVCDCEPVFLVHRRCCLFAHEKSAVELWPLQLPVSSCYTQPAARMNAC